MTRFEGCCGLNLPGHTCERILGRQIRVGRREECRALDVRVVVRAPRGETHPRDAETFERIVAAGAKQAGREVRVMVKPEDVDDVSAQVMARDIAKQVEEELQYPGQIKITVVRETRSVEYAK